eukprot:CAMPEP_0175371076 /NCGR_PEP_ID=MMETSP0095-20121207/21533_1 /TAXON_ID=311494 /ORGANISM="Alexandrium monilatum, Strain CCMP3105" /LENGTH=452 /DNA_ID=CAMNT_0016669237 /DNA_START=10 /DNA_END=1370 /DNA_ORIENTATION=-
MASQSKAATPKATLSTRRWGAFCAGAGAAAMVLPGRATALGFASPARTVLPSAGNPASPILDPVAQEAVQGASVLSSPAALAGGLAAATGLMAGAATRKSRRARAAKCAASACGGMQGKKTQCLHPDKPIMFACADCPRRGGVIAQGDLDDVAVAAYSGEGTSGVLAKKTQCLHPDKPIMFACADCPRRNGKACVTECGATAAAAFVGECETGCVAQNAKKTQCLHPDKPVMFACADALPALGQEEAGDVEVSAAAYVGECPGALGKKTQCLHPDKPIMFACADCPRRGGKAPAGEADELAAAAFVGEGGCSVPGKKTQCLHPDKPMMFACADCPRRGGKVPVAELDGEEVAVAAYTSECACSGAVKKTQCLHPDKPIMFACADCPRRAGKAFDAAGAAEDGEVAVAAFAGESAEARVVAKKDRCLHPDKPIMFAARTALAADEELQQLRQT